MGSPAPAYGGGVADTVVNPFALAATLVAGLLILFLPRKYAITPFLVIGVLIPINQVVVIVGLHFFMLRLLSLFGLARMCWAKLFGREEILSGGMNAIDKALIVLTAFTFIDGVLLWHVLGEVVYQLGVLYTTFGVYFLFRFLVRNQDDIDRVLKVLACVTLVIAGFMTYESLTGRDLFYAVLGGVDAQKLAKATERANSFRAQGCFGSPIIAGTFGGFVAPLFIGWWVANKRGRMLATLGAAASIVIPLSVGSSTALGVLIASVIALFMWPLRRKMRAIRWGIVGTILGLDCVMKAPVWELIARIHLADESSSWHRYELVNQCIIHFSSWALVGTRNFASWGWEMGDLANQYVATADKSGLIPLTAFVVMLVFACKYIGRAREYFETDKRREFFAWAVGCSLFGNLVGFFGIGYWDQVIVPWYGLLAIISAVSLAARTQGTEVSCAVALRTSPSPRSVRINSPQVGPQPDLYDANGWFRKTF